MSTLSLIKIIYKRDIRYVLYDLDSDTALTQRNGHYAYRNIEDVPEEYFETVEYDYDNTLLEGSVDYNDILEKWNLLNDIAGMFKMYFDGDSNKMDNTYQYLFACCLPKDPLPPRLILPEWVMKDVRRVFRRAGRVLDKLIEKS